MPPIARPLRPIRPMPPGGVTPMTADELAAAYAQLTPEQQAQATWVAQQTLRALQAQPPDPSP